MLLQPRAPSVPPASDSPPSSRYDSILSYCEGLVRLASNPHQARARLVLLTAAAERAFAAAHANQVPWVNAIAKGLPAGDIRAAQHVLVAIRARIERDFDPKRGGNRQ